MSTSAFASPVPVLPVTGATRLATGGLFIATAVLSFAPIAVLGPAIGWPASLRAPAAQQLAMIGGAPDAVALGYGIYLLYSLLVLPVMVLLALRVSGSLARPLAMLVVTLAALSVLARCIGILRWLTVMPALANQHAVADPGQKKVIETVFLALTSYGGSIGEILGVSLFMALSLGLATITALVNKTLPAWLAAWGLVSALLLLGLSLPALGIAVQIPIALAASMLSVWMLAAGMVLALQRDQESRLNYV